MVSFTDLANDIIAKYYNLKDSPTNDDYIPTFYVSDSGSITFVNYNTATESNTDNDFNNAAGYGAFNNTKNEDLNNLFNTVVKQNLEYKYKDDEIFQLLSDQAKTNLFNIAMIKTFSDVNQYVLVENMASIENKLEEIYGQMLKGANKDYLENYLNISLLAGRTPSTRYENHERQPNSDVYRFLDDIIVNSEILDNLNKDYKTMFPKSDYYFNGIYFFLFMPDKGRNVVEIGEVNTEKIFKIEFLINSTKNKNYIINFLDKIKLNKGTLSSFFVFKKEDSQSEGQKNEFSYISPFLMKNKMK